MGNNASRRTPFAVLLILLFLGSTLAILPAPVFALGCGSVITTSTALTGNIGPCSGDGLIIGASGIVLDCNGAWIVGSNAPDAAGITLTGRSSVTIENCIIAAPVSYHWEGQGFGYGFLLNSSSGNTFSGDTILNMWGGGVTKAGFSLSSSSSGNLFVRNTNGNYVLNSSSNNNRLIGNTATTVDLIDSSGNTLTDNTANSFYLGSSNGNTLTNNTASGGSYGFYLSRSSGNTLNKNTANSNGVGGFYLNDSSRNTLSENRANSDVTYGFSVQASSNNNILTGNVESRNTWGYFVWDSSGNAITASTAVSNSYGFYLASARGNTLTGNTAYGDGYDGFYVDGNSSKNAISEEASDSNAQYGYLDYSAGSGTNRTANQYSLDECRANGFGGSSPTGLCSSFEFTSTLVSCTPQSMVTSAQTKCAATISGGSSPGGTVTFLSTSIKGTFFPSNGQCLLSSGSCSVNYTDRTAGSPAITAFYGGDSNNAPSLGSTTLTVGSGLTAVPGSLYSASEFGNSWTYQNSNICGTAVDCNSLGITITPNGDLQSVDSSGNPISFDGIVQTFSDQLTSCASTLLSDVESSGFKGAIVDCIDASVLSPITSQKVVGNVTIGDLIDPGTAASDACTSGLDSFAAIAFQPSSNGPLVAALYNFATTIEVPVANTVGCQILVPFGVSVLRGTPILIVMYHNFAAPTIGAGPRVIESGQSSTLSTLASFSGGAAPYTCQWLQKTPAAAGFANLGGFFKAGCTTSSKPSKSTGILTAPGTWSFELRVKDATGKSVISTPVKLTVTKATTHTTISCTKSSFAKGTKITCTATVAGPYPSRTGKITWSKISGTGKVTFSKTICTLSSGRCSVTITGTAMGSVTIKATYSGDPHNLPSIGTKTLTIV